MSIRYPILGDIWPYREAGAAPELAALPVDRFFSDPAGSRLSAADWVFPADPAAAPRAAYALRLRQARRQGDIARWDPHAGEWRITHRFAVPRDGEACAIVELRGVLLGGVETPEALERRMKSLLSAELGEAKALRLLAKVLSVASVIALFYAVRTGIERHAMEAFALIFCLAFGIGMLAMTLRARTKALSAQGLERIREQFQFEYRKSEHGQMSLTVVGALLRDHDRRREEEAVLFGFLLLLCFAYFISPLVVVGAIVALVLVMMLSGDPRRLGTLGLALDRAETRLEKAALSFRASDDELAPPALRRAKKEVLRDRLRRYGDILARVRGAQGRARLTQDLAIAVAFLVIFSAYAFPVAAGFQKMSISAADSLVNTSLFRVAPVIILLSISRNAVALAQVANHRLARLGK